MHLHQWATRIALTFLEHFNVGEIVAIETYGFGSLQYERLAGRLSSLPTRRPACGSMPRRQRSFRGPTNGSEGLHGASFGELTDRGMIAVVVIWLRSSGQQLASLRRNRLPPGAVA
jgi:hypothetical protein